MDFSQFRFAQAGAVVIGLDIAEEQIQEARRRSEALGANFADFVVASAEHTGLPGESFDVVTASQSWLYFDKTLVVPEVKRVLKRDGLLVTSHLIWLPRQDRIAQASERLVLKHNPRWSQADLSGEIPVMPKWSEGHFRLHAMFVFDEQIAFTRESWRGRFRACRAIGATLTPEQTGAFDQEHEALLRDIAPEHFTVLHRTDAHILRPIR